MRRERTPQSDYLLQLGRTILEPYTRLPTARAAMITGSSAEGVSDHYSDLDMTVYYDGALPDEQALAAIREGHGAAERAWLLGDRADGSFAEAYELGGIQAQIGHATVATWENDIAEVLDAFAEIHFERLHRDAVCAIGQSRVQLVLQGDERFNIAAARIFKRHGRVLDVHQR